MHQCWANAHELIQDKTGSGSSTAVRVYSDGYLVIKSKKKRQGENAANVTGHLQIHRLLDAKLSLADIDWGGVKPHRQP